MVHPGTGAAGEGELGSPQTHSLSPLTVHTMYSVGPERL